MNSKLLTCFIILSFLVLPSMAFAYPSVYPVGVTICKPDKVYPGYTVLNPMRATPHGLPLIDLNGKVVHKWMGVEGQPGKVLPGGRLLAVGVHYDYNNWLARKTEGASVVELDWQGKTLWKFEKYEQRPATAEMVGVKGKTFWSSNIHHDIQREGNPVGYHAPGMEYKKNGKTLIAGSKMTGSKESATLYIVDHKGKIVWEWIFSNHAREMAEKGIADFQNTAPWVGPNRWYESDPIKYAAFHPENIITDDGQEVIYIIDHKNGAVVWQVGPKYAKDSPLRSLGMHLAEGGFKGLAAGGMLHHAHIIPQGLPGAGNVLVFNNNLPYSQVIEFNPVTLEKIWEYSGLTLGYGPNHSLAHSFFSGTLSGMQRLPNGNTLICEGNGGRIIEVTQELETVWEYIVPFMWYGTASGFGDADGNHRAKVKPTNSTYRAYRVPYDYVPVKPDAVKPVLPEDQFIYDQHLIESGGVEVDNEYGAFKRY